MDGNAVLRIAYGNQKFLKMLKHKLSKLGPKKLSIQPYQIS